MKRMLKAAVLCMAAGLPAAAVAGGEQPPLEIEIVVKENRSTLTATLQNNAAAGDFYRRLPFTVEVRDYAGMEKYAYLKGKPLDVAGVPTDHFPRAGEITYSVSQNGFALFYRDSVPDFMKGLVLLGRIDGDTGQLAGSGALTLTFQKKADRND